MRKNEIMEIAEKTLLMYLQSWGQCVSKRVEALNNAVQAAGIEATFEQKEDDPASAGWRSANEEHAKMAIEFRKELKGCWPKGQFEWERDAVYNLVIKYREKNGLPVEE